MGPDSDPRRPPFTLRRQARVVLRLGAFGAMVVAAGLDYLVRVRLRGRRQQLRHRAEWLHFWARRLARGFGLESAYEGDHPRHGLVVCNHISYLDILVIAARHPSVFVSKAEVRHWPVLGWLTACAGTLYIDRSSRIAASRVADEMHAVLEQGLPVVFFPEGTSSDGAQVLPFHSSLFDAAARQSLRVTPARLDYQTQHGDVRQEVAYWGDMTFVPHFIRLLSHQRVQAVLRYAEPLEASADRKVLAKSAHAAVTALGGAARGSSSAN